MRKGNMTTLVSVLAIALVALGVGAGTMAWFSTEEVSGGDAVFTSGIMSMESVGSSFSTPANWAPGDGPFTATFKLYNDGTIDILFLASTFTLDKVGSTAIEFAEHIEVIGWREYIPGVGWQDNFGTAQHIQTLVGDGDYPLTLLEVVQSYTPDEIAWHASNNHLEAPYVVLDQFGNYVKSDSDYVTGGGYDQLPGPAIIVDGTYQMELTFEFMTSAGNNLQGKTLTLYADFFGMQDISQRP